MSRAGETPAEPRIAAFRLGRSLALPFLKQPLVFKDLGVSGHPRRWSCVRRRTGEIRREFKRHPTA